MNVFVTYRGGSLADLRARVGEPQRMADLLTQRQERLGLDTVILAGSIDRAHSASKYCRASGAADEA